MDLKFDTEALKTNLRTLMKRAAHVNESALGRATGIPQSTINRILHGKTSDPRISTLWLLAEHFDISLDQLLSSQPLGTTAPFTQARHLPVLPWTDLARSIAQPTPHAIEWTATECDVSDQSFALQSKSVLTPLFPLNSLLIIDPNLAPIDGDLVVVTLNGTADACLRKMNIDGMDHYLSALLGNDTQPQRMKKQIKILGTLMQTKYVYRNKPTSKT